MLLHFQTVAASGLANNQSTEGFSTIVQALVKNSKYPAILGDDAVTQALTRQWLEYAVVCVNYADTSNNEKRILKVRISIFTKLCVIINLKSSFI